MSVSQKKPFFLVQGFFILSFDNGVLLQFSMGNHISMLLLELEEELRLNFAFGKSREMQFPPTRNEN